MNLPSENRIIPRLLGKIHFSNQLASLFVSGLIRDVSAPYFRPVVLLCQCEKKKKSAQICVARQVWVEESRRGVWAYKHQSWYKTHTIKLHIITSVYLQSVPERRDKCPSLEKLRNEEAENKKRETVQRTGVFNHWHGNTAWGVRECKLKGCSLRVSFKAISALWLMFQ